MQFLLLLIEKVFHLQNPHVEFHHVKDSLTSKSMTTLCHGTLTFFDSAKYALSFVFFCHLIRWIYGDWPSVEPWRQSPQLHH